MLAGKEEVMMFVQESAMKCNEGLPLFVREFGGCLRLLEADLDALLLDHDETSVNPLDLIDQLGQGDGASFWLRDHLDVLFGRGIIDQSRVWCVEQSSPLGLLQGGKVDLLRGLQRGLWG